MSAKNKLVLPVIVVSQFCCTSLWFAGNAIMRDLSANFQLSTAALGHLTAAVQFGFIAGTLVFALLTIADRFPPSAVFFASAMAGSVCNLGMLWGGNTLLSLVVFRFLTGFFLAGIYPVGMKIAADYYRSGLGKSLGWLVGALVLGTAFPHLLSGFGKSLPWRGVVISTSLMAATGGLLIIWLVPEGPYRKAGSALRLRGLIGIFDSMPFRQAAFGYFGHMWELYAFWAFVPVMISGYLVHHPALTLNISLYAFLVIGSGGLACVFGGLIAHRQGNRVTALTALLLSGMCCLVSPIAITMAPPGVFIGFIIFWGWVVVADSPLFSTLVAENSNPQVRGSALTIVNCIGFSITIISIQLLNYLRDIIPPGNLYLLLALGPAFGLLSQFHSRKGNTAPDIR